MGAASTAFARDVWHKAIHVELHTHWAGGDGVTLEVGTHGGSVGPGHERVGTAATLELDNVHDVAGLHDTVTLVLGGVAAGLVAEPTHALQAEVCLGADVGRVKLGRVQRGRSWVEHVIFGVVVSAVVVVGVGAGLRLGARDKVNPGRRGEVGED